MARFITMLSGSLPSLVGTLAGHDVRTITNGENFRNGLIASRSALSTDIYAELSPINQDGGRGVFFPVDRVSTTAVAGQITASAYTSSRAGITIPADYSIRPTASVLSTDALSVETVPINLVSASLVTYESASKAVKDTLEAINLSTGTPDNLGGPYTRLGLNPSRTVHSIYYNPSLAFFAWDDFTPGTPNPTNFTVGNLTYFDGMTSNSDVVYLESGVDTFNVTASWTAQYAADPLGSTTVSLELKEEANSSTIANSATAVTNKLEATFSFPAAQFARFSSSQGLIAGTYQVRFSDEKIPAHLSSVVTKPETSLGVRGQILYRRTDARGVKVGDFNASTFCSITPETVFTVNTLASSSRLYANKVGGIYYPSGVEAGVEYYVAFGELINGQTIYEYDTGVLTPNTTTVSCDTSGTTTTTSTTTIQCDDTEINYRVIDNSGECITGNYPESGYFNGAGFFNTPGCTSGISDTYVQYNGVNYTLNGSGIIVATFLPDTCFD